MLTEAIVPVLAEATKKEGLLTMIYGDLAKPGVMQVGKALGAVLGLGNTILWPIHLINEKAAVHLKSNLEELRARLASKDMDEITQAVPEVGVPVAEKLTYVQDKELRNLYISLLERSTIISDGHLAHPSFVNVINNLAPDEARALRHFIGRSALPFVYGRIEKHSGDSSVYMEPVTLYTELGPDIKLDAPQNIEAYFENLESLGLVTIDRVDFFDRDELYASLLQDLEAIMPHHRTDELDEIVLKKGCIELTKYGQLFVSCCVQN